MTKLILGFVLGVTVTNLYHNPKVLEELRDKLQVLSDKLEAMQDQTETPEEGAA